MKRRGAHFATGFAGIHEHNHSAAFTLLELLCVMAIIAILASMLLPALTQAQARAKRIQCISQLHQAGLAFHNFAHDHNGKFPMQSPLAPGSFQTPNRIAQQLSGEFYLASPYFAALSGELVTPRVLLCPSDTRQPAATFLVLSNENLSYFVGTKADFARPSTILAGDRNITNAAPFASPVMADATAALEPPVGTQEQIRWTPELHRLKGNLLFSDAHAELAKSFTVQHTGPTRAPSSPGLQYNPNPVPSSRARPSGKPLPHDSPAGQPKPSPAVMDGTAMAMFAAAQSLSLPDTTVKLSSLKPASTNSSTPPAQPKPNADVTNAPSPSGESVTIAQTFSLWNYWPLLLLALLLFIVLLYLLEKRRQRTANRRRRPVFD